MPANRNIKGLYALFEAFWDFTKIISCSIRGAILVAFCFLGAGILVIASMFVIGHNHDKNLAAEIRAQNEALAKMASQGSAHQIPIAPHYAAHGAHTYVHATPYHPHSAPPTQPAHLGVAAHDPRTYTYPAPPHLLPNGSAPPHDPYSAGHPTYPSSYQAPAHLGNHSAHFATPAPGGYTRHGAYAAHSAYPAAHSAFPTHAAHPAQTAYPAHATNQHATYPVHSYSHHEYHQPVNPVAVDSIYDSAVTRSQYDQMMQNTPMVANPHGNSINFDSTPAPISQPPSAFGSPHTPVDQAVAAAEQFAGTAGRAEARGSSVSNTY